MKRKMVKKRKKQELGKGHRGDCTAWDIPWHEYACDCFKSPPPSGRETVTTPRSGEDRRGE